MVTVAGASGGNIEGGGVSGLGFGTLLQVPLTHGHVLTTGTYTRAKWYTQKKLKCAKLACSCHHTAGLHLRASCCQAALRKVLAAFCTRSAPQHHQMPSSHA